MNVWQRISKIYSDPKATFSSFERSITLKDVTVPILILLVVSFGAQLLVGPIAINEQISRIEQRQDIPPEQKEAILDRMDSIIGNSVSVKGFLLTTVTTLLGFVLLAGVVLFFGSFILAGEATFQQALAVVVFVGMIGVLEWAVKIPLILQSGTIQVETGMALFLPVSLDGSLLYRFFHRLDFFAMWKIALIAMGTATVFRTTEKSARLAYYSAWAVLMFLLAWLFDGRMMA
ncbi:MAG: YIP1 family protein [Candidatus Marinimicrobia bacterium]|nr:YIP1 family protein [Candidatus Neomarinimicrobiota bacterium]